MSSLATAIEFDWSSAAGASAASDQGSATCGPRPKRQTPPAPTVSELFAPDEYAAASRFASVQQRLVRLQHALYEESGSIIDSTATRSLLRVLSAYAGIRQPSITVGPTGLLSATWRNSLGEELAIRFTETGVVHFAIVSVSPMGGATKVRRWGTSSEPVVLFLDDATVLRIASRA